MLELQLAEYWAAVRVITWPRGVTRVGVRFRIRVNARARAMARVSARVRQFFFFLCDH